MKNYNSSSDFIENYPFIPYHFQLIQKIFESIRKAGATGLHLSRGERSMLDAFQSAASNIGSEETGALVPLYEFFPCIESFLDTAVKRSIDQAKDNPKLSIPSDVRMLQTLFLIRYVDIVKPKVENLVTLCIDKADTDRIVLKQKIEAALERLEKENLIHRNGDLYFFLTNEEREVSREIKNVDILSSDEVKLLGNIIFEDILVKKTKHRYAEYKRDYPFNRICDGQYWGKEQKVDLGLEIISPLHDEYAMFIPAKCILHSSNRDAYVIVKLGDDPRLLSDIRTFLQTEKYVSNKTDASASPSLKQILRDRAEQNQERKERLTVLIENLIVDAQFFTLGKSLETRAVKPASAVGEAFDHLIQNVFRKFSYLSRVYDDPIREIRETLSADDLAQQQMQYEFENNEPSDIREIRTVTDLKIASNKPLILDELLAHFAKRPYGWDEFQTLVRIAKIFMAGTISLVVESAKIPPKDALAPLSKTRQWKTVKILKRKTPSEADIKKAKACGKELFASIAPDGQDKLSQYIRDGLNQWMNMLQEYKALADTGNYPGKKEIDAASDTLRQILGIHDSYELIKAFNERKQDLEDAHDDLSDLKDFYSNQQQTWEQLREAMTRFRVNQTALEKNADARQALKRMNQILKAPSPYGMLKEVNALISRGEAANEVLIRENRQAATKEVDDKISDISSLLNQYHARDDVKNQMLFPLQAFRKKIQSEHSIPQISYFVKEAQEKYEDEWDKIEGKFKPKPSDGKKTPAEKKVKTIRPASLKQKAYLDTEDDVAVYIRKLKDELLNAIQDNQRIRIM